MGNKASKPARKFTDTVSKGTVNRSSQVNQLPSQTLRLNYEKHHMEKSINEAQNQEAAGTKINSTLFLSTSHTSFDPSYLKKKLKSSSSGKGQKDQTQLPEGKDGFDPQGKFDDDFIKSITRLGKLIESKPESQHFDTSLALEQLRFRKDLYAQGQKELDLQKNQGSYPQSSNGSAGKELEVVRTMVHPRTLGAILTDIRDPRIDNERIILDYQLHSNFLDGLGKRFKLATHSAPLDPKPKDDEIGPREEPVSNVVSDKDGADNIDKKKLKKLQERISLED
ncbi:uncharacterized protein PRCAT00005285001 [Priceomyces carsonii]|uniref:uncharacterized protein n=1 Tax=Priceomyces carsonii TaxID=28549 RepID=UPI002EDAAB59|nr:unnamed protein product [Priceomyces carsonii]